MGDVADPVLDRADGRYFDDLVRLLGKLAASMSVDPLNSDRKSDPV